MSPGEGQHPVRCTGTQHSPLRLRSCHHSVLLQLGFVIRSHGSSQQDDTILNGMFLYLEAAVVAHAACRALRRPLHGRSLSVQVITWRRGCGHSRPAQGGGQRGRGRAVRQQNRQSHGTESKQTMPMNETARPKATLGPPGPLQVWDGRKLLSRALAPRLLSRGRAAGNSPL